MKKVQELKKEKFLIVCEEKVYKFTCTTEEERGNWIKSLNGEMKKLKGDSNKVVENLYEIKLKKKVIEDYYRLPNINAEKLNMKKRVDETIKTEKYFVEKLKA